MANVDTEPQDPGAPPNADARASVAVIEENLAALLRAVTAPAEATFASPPLNFVPVEISPAPAAPVQETFRPAEPAQSALPDEAAQSAPGPEEPHNTDEARSPEIPAATSVLEASESEPQRESHPEAETLPSSPVRDIAPVAEPQQEVVSKLALLFSIKQRRAVAMRPGLGASSIREVETAAPEARPIEAALPENAPASQATERAVPEHPLPDTPLREIRSRETAEAAVETAVPAKGAPRKDAGDQPASHASPAPSTFTGNKVSPSRASSTLFAPVDEKPSAKPKSFATSTPGLAMIGGTILAVYLIASLLTENATRPSPPKSTVTGALPSTLPTTQTGAPARVAPAAPSAAAPEKLPAAGSPAVNPQQSVKKGENASPKPDAEGAGKPPTAPAAVNTNPLPANAAAAPPARAFTPPSASARPAADTTIREAPPALSPAATPLPTVAALPSNIAPPPPAPTKTTTPREISIPSEVQANKLVRSVTPSYPALAKTTRVQGIVRFRVTIGTDGRVRGLMLMGGPPPLVQAAADALRQWRYQPTIVNGEAVEVVTEIELAFKL